MASENAAAQPVVHIIDDDEGLRESLAFLLRTARSRCGVLSRPKHFLRHCRMLPSVAS